MILEIATLQCKNNFYMGQPLQLSAILSQVLNIHALLKQGCVKWVLTSHQLKINFHNFGQSLADSLKKV